MNIAYLLGILVPKFKEALACCSNTVTGASGSASLTGGTVVLGLQTNSAPFTSLGQVLNTLIPAAIITAGIITLIFIIIGGFQYITSGGDKVASQAARDRIVYAILGLIIIVASVAIIQVLGAVFGFNITGTIKWPGPPTTIGK